MASVHENDVEMISWIISTEDSRTHTHPVWKVLAGLHQPQNPEHFSSKLTIFPSWDGMLNFGIIYYTEEHDYAFKVCSNSAH